jgi:predicted RNA-binding protein YlxR (DUF448 family)
MASATHRIETETDSGPRTAGRNRLCIATRAVRPVEELIRFVAGPDGLVPDLKRKLPGRGVWVTARREAVTEAVRRGAFRRSLKSDVAVGPDLPERVERLLVRSALDALAIAAKAGLVATGFTRAEKAIVNDDVVALLHAADAASDGTRKLDMALSRRFQGADDKPAVIRAFTSAELDLALGRSNVVHACLLAGRAATTFVTRWQALERYRSHGDYAVNQAENTGAPDTAARQPGME